MSYVIWIDENIDSEENIEYSKKLDSMGLLNFTTFKEIDDAIKHMKLIQFQETKVIIPGRLYSEFIDKFEENITEMCFVPNIIIFTRDKEKFIEYNNDFQSHNSSYPSGRIATTFNEIKKLIKNKKRKNDEESESESESESELNNNNQFTFDYVDCLEKLALPMFFKSLLDKASNDNMKEYTNSLYNTYSRNNDKIKSLLGSIKSMENVPMEILSKYFARFYTAESDFYNDMNRDLGLNKKEPYLLFIKTLYEGVKLKSLSLAYDNILYRAAKISKEEAKKIKNFLNNKKPNLSGSIAFSKSFLSFSKEREVAEQYLNKKSKNKKLLKVLYILERDDNMGYDLSTHGDIEKISFYPNEKEVLFFPFSAFEIKEIEEIYIDDEKGYQIKLLYLGKYLREIENNKNIIIEGSKIPDCEFKKQLCEFGLIEPERIENINTKKLYNEYRKYEEEIEENSAKRRRKNNNIENNIITGEVNITPNDINEDIQIINSFENYKKMFQLEDKNDDDWKYENEKEIKENVEIKINGEKIDCSYYHKFNKEGIYKIEYLFKKNMRNTNHMFYNCKSLTNINLSKFKAQYVNNMNYMFCYCKSLTNLDLSNFNTHKVYNMSYMFHGCESLTDLNLSSFKTQNVTNMEGIFHGCECLTDLNISNFNTQNVTNMEGMFYYCKSLTDLNLSSFNTQNVTKMNGMFYNCESLTNLNLSNFNTQNVTKMNRMFYDCKSLTYINLSNFKTHNVTDMSSMFRGCESLKNLNLSNFNTQNVTNMYEMFLKCNSLKKLNLLNFNTQNVTNMSHMFESCKSLTKSNIITEDDNISNIIDNLYFKK